MHFELGRLAIPVFQRAWEIQDRLDREGALAPQQEQAALVALLRTSAASLFLVDEEHSGKFAEARYALACWLDATFTDATGWSSSWPAVEQTLFGTSAGERFWAEADRALTLGSADLPVIYLCVAFGYRRGRQRDWIEQWAAEARTQIARQLSAAWVSPAALDPGFRAPPLRGAQRLKKAFVLAALPIVGVVPALAYWAAKNWM